MPNSDGSVVIGVNLNIDKAEKELGKLKAQIEKTESEIDDASKKRSEAQQKSLFQAAELDAEKAKLQEIKDRLADIRAMSKDKSLSLGAREEMKAQIPAVQQELADQKTRVSMLQTEWNKTENVVARYNQKIDSATSKLDAQKTKAGMLTKQVDRARSAAGKLGAGFKSADGAVQSLLKRVKSLAARVLVFSVLLQALRAIKDWFGKVIKSNDEANNAIARMKGALLTLAQPLVDEVIPAFTTLVNILTKTISAAAAGVSILFGKTAAESAKAAEALHAQMEETEGVNKATKDAAKTIAGFDEINLSSSEDTSTSATGTTAPDFSAVIDTQLGEIEGIVGVALLAIGAILTFSGWNIPLGIALMAAGALTLFGVAKENPGALISMLQGQIGLIVAIVSVAFLAIGAILAFSGIAIPLGIALMVLGAAGLAATTYANWNSIVTALQGPIGLILGIISGMLLVLGIILLFSGVGIPLGLGLIVAGAIGLVAAIAPNLDAIASSIKNAINSLLDWVKTYGMLILGIILCLTGVGIGSGLSIIYNWAKDNADSVPLANKILEFVMTVWRSVTNFWNQYIAPVFTSKFWLDLAKNCGNGLISGFEGAINGIIIMFETMINWIVNGLNKISISIPSWVPGIGGETFGINIPPVSFGRVEIPRLANGAVIPPNREFMAILGDQKHGTNVEAPLETIQEAVNAVMAERDERLIALLMQLVGVAERIEQKDTSVTIGDETIGRANDRYVQNRGVRVNSGAFSNAY